MLTSGQSAAIGSDKGPNEAFHLLEGVLAATLQRRWLGLCDHHRARHLQSRHRDRLAPLDCSYELLGLLRRVHIVFVLQEVPQILVGSQSATDVADASLRPYDIACGFLVRRLEMQ